jgi:ABC-type transport system involved in multi-copper enzyme maturation permease subunit
VFGWELRRLAASRGSWLAAAGTLLVFGGLLALSNALQGDYRVGTPHGVFMFNLPTTTVYGLLLSYPQNPGMFFGLLLPFVAADSVGRDLRRRTHELLMATPITNRAYIWGRYLAGLVFSLALASMILAAMLAVAMVSHQADPDTYPSVAVFGIVEVWALVVLPPVFLLSGVSFALGTLFPRRASLMKVAVMLGWFVAGGSLWYLLNPNLRDPNPPPAPFSAWDPTSIAPSFPLNRIVLGQINARARSLDAHAFHLYAAQVIQTVPDVSGWILPHVCWSAVGMLAAAFAATAFRRFRHTL